MRRTLIVGLLALAALFLVTFLTARKPAAPQYATRASDDYAFGGYRAWYELLAREGLHVERFHTRHDALGSTAIDTLVTAFPEGAVGAFWNAGERDALRGWVRDGGRLIDIGITPATGKDDGIDEPVFGVQTQGDSGALRGPWTGIVGALPMRGLLRIGTKPHAHVQTLLADGAGGLVVRYRLGRGEVIAVSSAETFENRNLARGDDARLAYVLGAPRRSGAITAFDEAVRGDVDGRAWYLALNVPERVGLAFAALAGLLWLAYGAFSLGPPVRLRAAREPASDEFLDAVAALYGRNRARDHARDALVREARGTLAAAPRTAENRTLASRVDAAALAPVASDAALVALAVLAREARGRDRGPFDPARPARLPRRGLRRGRIAGGAV